MNKKQERRSKRRETTKKKERIKTKKKERKKEEKRKREKEPSGIAELPNPNPNPLMYRRSQPHCCPSVSGIPNRLREPFCCGIKSCRRASYPYPCFATRTPVKKSGCFYVFVFLLRGQGPINGAARHQPLGRGKALNAPDQTTICGRGCFGFGCVLAISSTARRTVVAGFSLFVQSVRRRGSRGLR